MLFLNSWLLLGLAAVAVPILIHLLNRRQARVEPWGAMQFLLRSMISRRRRLLLEELLLMACRCLLVALTALALARPFIPAGSRMPWMVVLPAAMLAVGLLGASYALAPYPVWRRRLLALAALLALLAVGSVLLERWLNLRRFGRTSQRDIALVIDGSSSMLMTVGGKTNFQRALDEAQQLVQAAPRGIAFSIVVGGAVPSVLAPVPVTDRRHLLRLLSEALPVHGTMPALDTLAVAATTLAQGYQGAKQIIVIGDGQRIGWETGDPESWAHLRAAFARLPSKPQVVWRRLPLPATIRNAAIGGITFSRPVIGTDRPVQVDVTVANVGTESVTPRAVRLRVGDRTQVDRTVGQLEPGVSRTVTFLQTFDRAGSAVVEAALEVDDELPADDRAVRVVQVLQRLRVLVLDGEASSRLLERPAAFLALGLLPDAARLRPDVPAGRAPATPPAAQANLLVEPVVMPATALATRQAFDDYAVVILADVPRLPLAAAEDLGAFVADGGGLLLTLGRRADAAFYNGWRASGERILPLTLAEFQVATPTNRPTLDMATLTHPALRAMAAASDLEGAAVEQWWRLADDDALAQVGVRLSDGSPLVVEKRLGRGRIVQLPLSLEPAAGTLVTRHSFVPFVHELVYHLARPVAVALNTRPARSLTLNLSDRTAERQSVGGGLLGEYFVDGRMRRAALVRTDPTVAFDWGTGAPGPGVRADNFSVRWTGSLLPPRTATYRIRASADDAVRLWLDGKALLAAAGEASVELVGGRRYDLRVEYQESGNTAQVRLEWEAPDLPRQVIPADRLSPARGRSVNGAAATVETTLKGPDAQPIKAQYAVAADSLTLQVNRSLPPGLYRAQVPAALAPRLAPITDRDGSVPFAVLVDSQESLLDPLGLDETDFIRQYVDFLVAGAFEDVLRALRGNAFGRELWRLLTLAVLVLLVLETALTRWIALQRRTGEEGEVTFEESRGPSEQFRRELARVRGEPASPPSQGSGSSPSESARVD